MITKIKYDESTLSAGETRLITVNNQPGSQKKLLEMSTISVAVTAKSNNNDDSITKLPDSSANSVPNQPVTYKITYLLGGNNVNNSGNINSYSPIKSNKIWLHL